MLGANNMNNMMVNSAHKPVHHVGLANGEAGASSAGCLGLPAGGSGDAKSKGKGKGKTNPNFPKFQKPPKKEKKLLLAWHIILSSQSSQQHVHIVSVVLHA